MHAINLIARHLDRALITDTIHPVDTVCAFTGQRITEGIKKKDAISDRFTDHQYLPHPSEYVSLDAWLCIRPVIQGEKSVNALRNYHFIATEMELRLLKRDEILELLLNINQMPFVICVTESNKKHLSFKASVNYNTDHFIVTTDFGDIEFVKDDVSKILPIIQKWYSVIKEGKDETFFTKDEIENNNFKTDRITRYGIAQFQREFDTIKPYFRTNLLHLLTFLLNKDVNYQHQLPIQSPKPDHTLFG